MQTTIIKCDHCQSDLSQKRGGGGQRLVLKRESIPNNSSVVYAVHIEPLLKRDHHFCALGCLSQWIGQGGERNAKDNNAANTSPPTTPADRW
jgi:hypothetical protein